MLRLHPLILAALVASSPLLADLAFLKEYKTTLQSVSSTEGLIPDSPEVIVGASGVVMHAFDNKTSSIIAQVSVIAKENGQVRLRFEPFVSLSQGAFPEPTLAPTQGDQVIINHLYSRALIVVPDQKAYEQVTKSYPMLQWIHPDLMASYLAKRYRPNPDRALFQEICHQNAASLIFFGINNQGHFVDCHNFNVLHTIALPSSKTPQLPFYSRIKEVDTSWFSWGSSQISDYHSHYRALLGK